MNSAIGIGVGGGLAALLLLYVRLLRARRRLVADVFRLLTEPGGAPPAALLVLHPDAAELDVLEPLLPALPRDWVVLYGGPAWLTDVKRSKWGCRVVRLAEAVETPAALWRDSFVAVRRRRGFTLIHELYPYVAGVAQQSRAASPSRGR